jgi:hypothetical protein
MNGNPIAFLLSLAFLLGVALLLLSSLPALRARFPRLFAWGFLLAAGAIIAMFIVSLIPFP